jgi:Rrf2 family cysteine metabolism transcriptional repressor
MLVSQKCRYALRALFELALSHGRGHFKTGVVADAQAIPQRFLEVILNELKQGGFVESRRGQNGGYALAVAPESLRVGDVVRFVHGPVLSIDEIGSEASSGERVLLPLWHDIHRATTLAFDSTTFADLVETHRRQSETYVPNYVI